MHEMITYALSSLAQSIGASTESVVRIFVANGRLWLPTREAVGRVGEVVGRLRAAGVGRAGYEAGEGEGGYEGAGAETGVGVGVEDIIEACLREGFDYDAVERGFQAAAQGATGVAGVAGGGGGGGGGETTTVGAQGQRMDIQPDLR